MSFQKMRNHKSGECRLLVKHSVIPNLKKILQNYEKLPLKELCSKYESEYEEPMEFFITQENELVIEVTPRNSGSSDKVDSLEIKLPKGWSGLEECIKKIDFSEVLTPNKRKICDRKVSAEEVNNYESIHFCCTFTENKFKNKEQQMLIYKDNVGKCEIPMFFDKLVWKLNNSYKGIVTHIYDLSKFWMRFADIQLLNKLLWEFYSEKKTLYAFSISDICIGINCIALISDKFCRGRIVKTDIQNPLQFLIFLYDSGRTCKVTLDNIFKMHEKFLVIPALAVRCSLYNISPIDNESWSEEAVTKFENITQNVELTVKVTHVKYKRKILEVYMSRSDVKKDDNILTLNYLFVCDKLAKISGQKPVKSNENPKFKSLRQFTYLYPTHEMIENGAAPSSFHLTKKLKQSVSWDVLFPDIYKYQE